MVKIVKLIIPGEDQNENQAFQAKFLDEKVIGQPFAAMYLVSQELNRGAELAEGMLDLAKESLTGTNRKEARMEFAGSCSAQMCIRDSGRAFCQSKGATGGD